MPFSTLGNRKIVESLLKADADVNYVLNGLTPLQYVASFDAPSEIAKMLIKNGADVNVNEQNKGTALHIAAN